ncbi:transposase [Herbivorax sp. ANBcel31]|uniref:IS91 family transposase n=1 Tax=Herbivorax sp. ANBcel31 TaxID=3069754 RepID=UPI0027B4A8AD|nr:transposase [Herbivorax sp. ANBcel31]MDQ2086460.1 transposase [Herbivorax sp. ANBcel31]
MNNIQVGIAGMLLSFKIILCLNDNWESYLKNDNYEIREVEKREVEKMLSCMDPDKGHSVYMCAECGKTKVVAHSCKSRICSVCGKKHADEWSEKINKEMYAVPYRHIILTVSDRLWTYFEGNSILQKLMIDTAAKVMKDIVRDYNGKDKKAEPGIIMVLHPFGRDLKTNMHVHMLMTEGGLSPNGKWISMPYINYKIIRKKWQYYILTALKKAVSKDKKLLKIIDWCFKERANGFNIQAKRRIEGKTKKAARYMARYVRHPAIADSRIIGYDTKNVTFVYEREGKKHTVVMDKFEFIHNVIKHIPDKNFKMVRYFGIHARRAKKAAYIAMEKLCLVVNYIIKPFKWRKNVEEHTGRDPLKCKDCNGEMLLYRGILS